MIYEINYNTLIRLLLPTFLRKSLMFAFLKCLVSPVSLLYGTFMPARRNDLFRESIDSTVPRLEYLLNTMFYPEGLSDAYGYRIIIGGTKKVNVLRIWLGGVMQAEDEGKPQWIETKYLYTNGETGEIITDFVVKVPLNVDFDELKMRAILQQYVLSGKEFEIIKY